MIRLFKYICFSAIFLFGCGKRDHVETYTIKIAGKPVNLVHTFHLSRGSLKLSYKGNINGKVGVCASDCEIIAENAFTENCSKIDTLSGNFNTVDTRLGTEEGIDAGRQKCFIFIPEQGSTGVIHVTFSESRIGGW
ncbi:hypothetical protein [uncultured Chryseobacterium sp.]|uniref:hypothetical protein n=1 Tax=uncultured Chryseobacterium sp. TaxID=259322 RepID=UPI0025854781|nr:hypothetical protein [uncultured Chryseobacterium sp.]